MCILDLLLGSARVSSAAVLRLVGELGAGRAAPAAGCGGAAGRSLGRCRGR